MFNRLLVLLVVLSGCATEKAATTASAYSVRPTPEARVSMPLSWADFLAANPLDFTLKTVPAIFAARGDAHAGIDAAVGTLDSLLELADAHEPAGKKQKREKLPVITIAHVGDGKWTSPQGAHRRNHRKRGRGGTNGWRQLGQVAI